MKTDNRLLRFLAAAAAIIIIIFFAAQMYNLAGKTYETQTVYEQTFLETEQTEMFVIRNEASLSVSAVGVTVPLAENAERVSKGSTIAAIFPSEAAAENYVEISSLTKKLETYQKIDSQLRLAQVDMDKLSSEIDSAFESLLDAAYENDFSNLGEDKLSFDEKLSRKQISLDENVDCSAKIAELQSKIAALNSSSTPSEIVTAEYSGYYVSREDGYENLISASEIDSLTPEKLKEAMASEKKEVAAGSIGKIIDGYNWYIASFLDISKAVNFKVGESVDLILDESSNETVSTEVYSVQNISEKESMIIFKCKLMNEKLASLRKVSGKIVLNQYTGLKVTRDAVRLDENGNAGVFIRRGNIVNFRSLNIIYSNEDFVIASKPSADSATELDYTHLKLYDEVIVSGKELKDGMVIR